MARPGEKLITDTDFENWKRYLEKRLAGLGSGSGASDFTDLGDVPGAYTGQGGKAVQVKADESGLEFISTLQKSHLSLTMSADQTTNISDGNPIKFNTASGTITYDTGTYRATLAGGKVYRLFGTALCLFSGAAGYTYLRWYDITNSAALGQYAFIVPTTHSSGFSIQPIFHHIIAPVTDIVIDARIVSPSALTTIYYAYTSASIWEL